MENKNKEMNIDDNLEDIVKYRESRPVEEKINDISKSNEIYNAIQNNISHNFEEIKRKEKVHNDIIKDIKLITLSISNNKNNFCKNFNVITIGKENKVKLVLNDN